MKIVGWEKADFDNDEFVMVDDVSVTYMQNPDCTEDRDREPQTITISSRNNGTSRFMNISTQNWSVSDADEMMALLEDFRKRAEIEKEKED